MFKGEGGGRGGLEINRVIMRSQETLNILKNL